MTRARLARRLLGRLVALLLVLGAGAALYLLRDPVPRFAERRSHIARVAATVPEAVDGAHTIETARVTAASGLVVELLVKRPATAGASDAPVLILLGGHRTGRDAARLIPDTRGTIVASLSYPFQGNPRLKGLGIIPELPAIRRALLDTPPAIMLALDYLLEQPYARGRPVELVGVSLGVPFATVAGALDGRVSRVWAIHGGGGSYTPLEHNVRREIPWPASVGVAGLSTVLIAGPRLDPERWAPRIAPRPFVMINALDDDRMPRASVEALYRSAREPKELIWVPGGHVRARPEVVRGLVDLVLSRVVAEDRRGATSRVRGGT